MSATRFVFWTACLLVAACPSPGRACRWCYYRPIPFREEALRSRLVLVGKLENVEHEASGRRSASPYTNLVITDIVKGDSALAGKKVIRWPEYINLDPKKPSHFLVFVDVNRGKLEFYRAEAATGAIAGYVKGLLAINKKDRVALLRYCSDFLEHPDRTIANDAFNQFTLSTAREVKDAARQLSPVKLRRWLKDRRTEEYRLPLYARLLGGCGDARDAALLRKLIDRRMSQTDPPSTLDGLLTGYILLDPGAGWALTRSVLAAPSSAFALRYAALRAAREFHITHRGVVAEKDIVAAVALGLGQADFADLAIETLRGWRCWKFTGDILPLFTRKGFEAPINRRSVVRYAVQCPDPRAARFVKQLRKTDPALVEQTEELLKLEAGK